jgi:hypothetical protein
MGRFLYASFLSAKGEKAKNWGKFPERARQKSQKSGKVSRARKAKKQKSGKFPDKIPFKRN